MSTKSKSTKKATPRPKTESNKPVDVAQALDQPIESAPTCPTCGAPMVRRSGPYGEFFGCSRFKSGECKTTLKAEQ